MGKIIAIAGKGGVGKTTVSSLLIRYLCENGSGSVLAVDADPNSNLSGSLGISSEQDIGKIIDDISKNLGQIPVNMSKDEFISYRIEETLAESQGFDLLTMGRPEGPGCYCYVNNVLRNTLSKLMSSYDYIVIDNEAGFEHLSRRTVKKLDTLIIVSDSTCAGLMAAQRIFGLVKELNIEYKNIFLILNRTKDSANVKIDFPVQVMGTIPNDQKLSDSTQANIREFDAQSDVVKAANKIFSEILERSKACLKN